jgi:hypothetical protein
MKWLISLIFLLLVLSLGSQNADPRPHSFLAADGTLFVNEYYKLNWEKGESGVTYHYQWNDEPWAKFSEPMFPPVSGWNEIHFFAEDLLGNRESEQKINLYVDKSQPRISVIWKFLPKSWNDISVAQSNNEIRLRAIDDESGIEAVYVKFDSEPEVKVEKGMEWNLLTNAEGKHQVIAYSVDNVKNVSKKIEVSWMVDSTPPTLSLLTVPKSISLSEKQICLRNTKIQINSTDTLTETKDLLWRKKGTELWTLTNKIFDIEKIFPYDKKVELEFKAKDFSGNETSVLEFKCDIDRDPPETQIRIQN